ncbi:MAG: hypothetical protein K1X79_03700 [Oligoflexia bacterium]|nr:hypothetical protein [Oligoflexia bacterium]
MKTLWSRNCSQLIQFPQSLLTSVILLVFIYSLQAVQAETTVQATFTSHGRVVLQETSEPGESAEQSLINLYYAQGAMHWWQSPLLLMLYTAMNLPHDPPSLNVPEFNRFLRTTNALYQPFILSATPIVRQVEVDGTVPRLVSTLTSTSQIRAYMQRLGIPDETAAEWRDSNPFDRRILSAWLQGAQFAAIQHREEFYNRHPALRATGLLEAFLDLTVQDLFAIVAGGEETIYDNGTLIRTAQALANLLRTTRPNSSLPIASFNRPSAIFIGFQKPSDTPGGSNGASVSYISNSNPNSRQCITMGEGHLPSTAGEPFGLKFQLKVSEMLVHSGEGIVPFVGAHYLGTFVAPLQASAHHSTSLTAGPSGSSFLFATETDGQNYLAADGSWRPFISRTISSGQALFGNTVLEIPEFGSVVFWAHDPGTNKDFAVTMRRKSHANTVHSIISKMLAGIKNDAVGYRQALREGTSHWGESGCGPNDNPLIPASRMPYLSLNQGTPDLVNDDSISAVSINKLKNSYKKLGQLSTPVCYNFATASDNGPIRDGGCASLTIPNYLDPGHGYPTYRQFDVLAWAERFRLGRPQETPVSDDEVLKLATSTHIGEMENLGKILVESVRRYAAAVLTPDQLQRVQQFTQTIINYDGVHRDSAIDLVLFRMRAPLAGLVFANSSVLAEPVRRFLNGPDEQFSNAAAALDLPAASALIALLTDALSFYDTRCAAHGINTWSQAVGIIDNGSFAAEDMAGPSFGGGRSSGSYRFLRDSSGNEICKLELYSSTPFKLIASEDQLNYASFGTSVEPTHPYYNYTLSNWWQRWGTYNRDGDGYSGTSVFENVSLKPNPVPTPIADALEVFTFTVPQSLRFNDCDRNGIPDQDEVDNDADQIPDACEACPNDPGKTAPGVCGCGVAEQDLNNNRITDCLYIRELRYWLSILSRQIRSLRNKAMLGAKAGSSRRIRLNVTFSTQQVHIFANPYIESIKNNRTKKKVINLTRQLDTVSKKLVRANKMKTLSYSKLALELLAQLRKRIARSN